MITENLQRAIDGLVIQDVYLRNSQMQCTDGFDPKYTSEFSEIYIQELHAVKHAEVVELGDEAQLLRVTIAMGTRWVKKPEAETEDVDVLAFIEADFIAEYSMQPGLEPECVDEFAMKNASFHVWPYWREYLASHCERMRLPRLVIPAMQLNHHRRPNTTE